MNLLLGTILRKRVTLRRFIVLDDFGHLFPEFAKQMGELIKAGKVQYPERNDQRLGTCAAGVR